MKKSDALIIMLIIISIAILVTIFSIGSGETVKNTKLEVTTNGTVKNGDALKVTLKDEDGNPIANETVKVVLMDIHGKRHTYSAVTDSNGVGEVVIMLSEMGKVSLNISYEGSDKFNSTSTLKDVIIVAAGSSDSADTSYDPSSYSDTSNTGSGYDSSSYSDSSYSYDSSSYSDSSNYNSYDSGYSDSNDYSSQSYDSGYESSGVGY